MSPPDPAGRRELLLFVYDAWMSGQQDSARLSGARAIDDGREVEAYTLDPDQVRGRRRIRSGDYRAHLAPAAPTRQGGAWSQWAKSRGRT